MRSFLWSLSSNSRRRKSQRSNSRHKNKGRSVKNVVILSDDPTNRDVILVERSDDITNVKFGDTRHILDYDSPVTGTKRHDKGAGAVDRAENSDVGMSGLRSRKDKDSKSLFGGRNVRKAKKRNIKVYDVPDDSLEHRKKRKGKEISTNVGSSSASLRITRSKMKELDNSKGTVTKEYEARDDTEVSVKKRKRNNKEKKGRLEPGRQRKRSKKDEWLGIRTRSSPTQFARCIMILSDEQRLAVKELGFGKILNFRMESVPSKLAHYVVDNFNPKTMEIIVPSGKIHIDVEVVHQLLGIPLGGVSFNQLERLEKCDEGIQKWRDRFDRGRFASPTQMVDMIEFHSDGEDNFDFRMDFLMCFYTVMVECHKQGSLKDIILEYFTDDIDFSGMDWCGMVVDKLKHCKEGWRRDNLEPPFVGPLALLTLAYVDSVACKGIDIDTSVYPMMFWNFQRLKEREKMEIKNGGFGIGKYKGLSSCDNIKDAAGEPTPQERVEGVDKLVDIMVRNKKRIEASLYKLYAEHPEMESVVAVKAKYESMVEDMVKMKKMIAEAFDIGLETINLSAHKHAGENDDKVSGSDVGSIKKVYGGDGVELSMNVGEQSPLLGKSRIEVPVVTDDVPVTSPVVSQYRKKQHEERKCMYFDKASTVDNMEGDGGGAAVNEGDHDSNMDNVDIVKAATLETANTKPPKQGMRKSTIRALQQKREALDRGASVIGEVADYGSEAEPNAGEKVLGIVAAVRGGVICTGAIKDSLAGLGDVGTIQTTTNVSNARPGVNEDDMVMQDDDVGEVRPSRGKRTIKTSLVGTREAVVRVLNQKMPPVDRQMTSGSKSAAVVDNEDVTENDQQNIQSNVVANSEPSTMPATTSFQVDTREDVLRALRRKMQAHDKMRHSCRSGAAIDVVTNKGDMDVGKLQKGCSAFEAGASLDPTVDTKGQLEVDGVIDTLLHALDVDTKGQLAVDGMCDAPSFSVGLTQFYQDEGNATPQTGGDTGSLVDDNPVTKEVTDKKVDDNYDAPSFSVGLTQLDKDVQNATTESGRDTGVVGADNPVTVDVTDKAGGPGDLVGDNPSTGEVTDKAGLDLVTGGAGGLVGDNLSTGEVTAKAGTSATAEKPMLSGVRVVRWFHEGAKSGDKPGGSNIQTAENYPMVTPVRSFDAKSGVYNQYGFSGAINWSVPTLDDEDNVTLAQRQKMIASLDAAKRNPCRERSVSYVHKSPYMIRGVDLEVGVTKEDAAIWMYICRDEDKMLKLHGVYTRKKVAEANLKERGKQVNQGSINEEESADPLGNELLFRSISNVEATRSMFKSLKPNLHVLDGIIDCWAEVLNYEEKFKSEGAYLRLFVGTKAVFP